MTITEATLSPDWEDQGVLVLEAGQYRAVVEVDRWPSPPECECQDPIVNDRTQEVVYGGMWSGHAPDTDYGKANRYIADVTSGYYSLMKNHDDRAVADRWLKIWHGGTTDTLGGPGWQDEQYTAFALPEARRLMGLREEHLNDPPYTEEWQAYIDGEVYFVTIQERKRAWRQADNAEISTWAAGNGDPSALYVESEYGLLISTSEEWEDVDVSGGFYGLRYAQESAEEHDLITIQD